MALDYPNDIEVGVEEIDQQPSTDEVKEEVTAVPVGILKASSFNEGNEQEEKEKTTRRKRKKRSAMSLYFLSNLHILIQ